MIVDDRMVGMLLEPLDFMAVEDPLGIELQCPTPKYGLQADLCQVCVTTWTCLPVRLLLLPAAPSRARTDLLSVGPEAGIPRRSAYHFRRGPGPQDFIFDADLSEDLYCSLVESDCLGVDRCAWLSLQQYVVDPLEREQG